MLTDLHGVILSQLEAGGVEFLLPRVDKFLLPVSGRTGVAEKFLDVLAYFLNVLALLIETAVIGGFSFGKGLENLASVFEEPLVSLGQFLYSRVSCLELSVC